jgi:hypothetical protein
MKRIIVNNADDQLYDKTFRFLKLKSEWFVEQRKMTMLIQNRSLIKIFFHLKNFKIVF